MTTPTAQHRKASRWAVLRARLRRVFRRGWVVAAVFAALFAAFVGFMLWRGAQTAETEQHSAQTQQKLEKVADPLAELCRTDESVRARVGDDACFTAAQVVSVPVQGPEGPQGAPGRGVTSTAIVDGHLLVTYSDGERVDVGRVVGPEGPQGEQGRGITASNIDGGRLVLTFSDGTEQDLGPIVGERGASGAEGPQGDPGRGISSTQSVEGRLIITYSDGTTEDAGPLPAGPRGPEGPKGDQGEPGRNAELPSSYTEAYPDGTSRTCTRAEGDTNDASPTYSCTERLTLPEEGP